MPASCCPSYQLIELLFRVNVKSGLGRETPSCQIARYLVRKNRHLADRRFRIANLSAIFFSSPVSRVIPGNPIETNTKMSRGSGKRRMPHQALVPPTASNVLLVYVCTCGPWREPRSSAAESRHTMRLTQCLDVMQTPCWAANLQAETGGPSNRGGGGVEKGTLSLTFTDWEGAKLYFVSIRIARHIRASRRNIAAADAPSRAPSYLAFCRTDVW